MTDQLTRRQLLERAALGGAAITIPGILAACGSSGTKASSGTTSVEQKLASNLHFSNWTLYIDTNKKNHTYPTLDEFTKKYGVNVDYVEDINDNEEFFGKIQAQLSRGQSIGRDIIVLTDNDRYLAQVIKKAGPRSSTRAAIPNIKNLVDVQQHPNCDPNRDYSLPWQSGMTGIAYNDTLTDPVLSVDQLLENPKLKGKITVLNSMGDAITLVMLANGDDPTKVTDKSCNAAFNRVKKAVDNGQIRQFTGNDYAPALAKGDLAAAMAWSGDIAQIGNKHLHWNVPEAGGALWTDNMLIPTGGDVYTASIYMNFVYDPRSRADGGR